MKTLSILLMTVLAPSVFAQDEQPAPCEAVCKQVKSIAVPKEDQPSKTEEADLASCDSEALYYGIGQAPDYRRARHCAYLEKQKGDDKVFGGSAILMMLYANGLGVTKNIPLAQQFACIVSGAPAEIEGRLDHLERLNSTKETTRFDLCDDITSGYMGGFCSKHSDRIAEVERNKHFQAMIDKWSASEKAAFKRLQSASNHFTEARVQNEVDQSGTLRGAMMIQEEAIQKEDFIQSLQKLEAKKAPRYTSAQYKEEDKKLNSLYQSIQKKEGDGWGTVTRDGIKITQRAWLVYRDAWIEFAKIKYPACHSDSIAAWFTKKRNHMLHSIIR